MFYTDFRQQQWMGTKMVGQGAYFKPAVHYPKPVHENVEVVNSWFTKPRNPFKNTNYERAKSREEEKKLARQLLLSRLALLEQDRIDWIYEDEVQQNQMHQMYSGYVQQHTQVVESPENALKQESGVDLQNIKMEGENTLEAPMEEDFSTPEIPWKENGGCMIGDNDSSKWLYHKHPGMTPFEDNQFSLEDQIQKCGRVSLNQNRLWGK